MMKSLFHVEFRDGKQTFQKRCWRSNEGEWINLENRQPIKAEALSISDTRKVVEVPA